LRAERGNPEFCYTSFNNSYAFFRHSRDPCEAHIVSEGGNPHIPSLRAQRGNPDTRSIISIKILQLKNMK
jgi:hypothetical protein